MFGAIAGGIASALAGGAMSKLFGGGQKAASGGIQGDVLDNQKEIAEMQNETQKEIAGIQSATSRQNTKDQVYAQNEMLAYQQKESTARVASIMENTNLSKQQQV